AGRDDRPRGRTRRVRCDPVGDSRDRHNHPGTGAAHRSLVELETHPAAGVPAVLTADRIGRTRPAAGYGRCRPRSVPRTNRGISAVNAAVSSADAAGQCPPAPGCTGLTVSCEPDMSLPAQPVPECETTVESVSPGRYTRSPVTPVGSQAAAG